MDTEHPFVGILLGWYKKHARPLPWRMAPEPYATWLSEVILQQTRVETGTAYWHRFLSAFPTVDDLANASPEEVMALWKGLGYYSRARNLHAAAKVIAEQRGGAMPDRAADWQTLPGVGAYTAAAIASICFAEPVPVIDGNVQRVMSRLFDIDEVVDRKAGREAIQTAANALVSHADPGSSNQGWMELGATLCKPKNPQCPDCPLQEHCLARQRGTALERPVKRAKKPPQLTHVQFSVHLRHQGEQTEWWVERRPEEGIWGGLESFPVRMTAASENAPELPKGWGPVEHILTHRRMMAWFAFSRTAPPDTAQGQWLMASDRQRTWPRLIDKVIEDLHAEAVKN